ncbi:MAG: hypothetical protein Q7U20_03015 [Caulobacter sp.]|nr:hypothetical protein [Caulobacter sp.]
MVHPAAIDTASRGEGCQMTDEMKTLKDDIAFMRALAQEGQRTPLLGGAILLTAGVVFAGASLAHWAVMAGVVIVSPWAFPGIWTVALSVFLITLTVLRRRMDGQPGASSPGNRAAGMAWTGVGWAIFTMAVVLAVISYRTHSPAPMMVFPSVILTFYGLGWTVAAAMSRKGWIWLTAIGSYVWAVVTAWFAAGSEVYLIYALALLMLAALPGFLLMRREPTDTV